MTYLYFLLPCIFLSFLGGSLYYAGLGKKTDILHYFGLSFATLCLIFPLFILFGCVLCAYSLPLPYFYFRGRKNAHGALAYLFDFIFHFCLLSSLLYFFGTRRIDVLLGPLLPVSFCSFRLFSSLPFGNNSGMRGAGAGNCA